MDAGISRLTKPPSGAGNVFSGRRVLITGHTGFKGSWLAFWLARLGADVTGFSLAPPTNPNLFDALSLQNHVRHIEGDLRDLVGLASAWAECSPEIVFHLAAQSLVRESYSDPLTTIETNILGTANLLDIARTSREPVGMVLVTSDKCYENRETTVGYRETDCMGGHDVYSMSKGAAELLISSYRRSFFAAGSDEGERVAIASARAGNVIGGGDWAADRIVPDCIRALQSGAAIEVRHPNAVRPWQHVLEPLSGYLALGALLLSPGSADAKRASEAWNLGPGEHNSSTVRELVERIVAGWGSGQWLDRSSPSHPHEAMMLRLSIEKAEQLLDWHPRWNFETTVSRTVDWYRAFYSGDDMAAWCSRQIDEYCEENS